MTTCILRYCDHSCQITKLIINVCEIIKNFQIITTNMMSTSSCTYKVFLFFSAHQISKVNNLWLIKYVGKENLNSKLIRTS